VYYIELKMSFITIKQYENSGKKIAKKTAIYDNNKKLLGHYSFDKTETYPNNSVTSRLYSYEDAETKTPYNGAITPDLYVKELDDESLELLVSIPIIKAEPISTDKRFGGRKNKKSKKKRTNKRKSRKTRK